MKTFKVVSLCNTADTTLWPDKITKLYKTCHLRAWSLCNISPDPFCQCMYIIQRYICRHYARISTTCRLKTQARQIAQPNPPLGGLKTKQSVGFSLAQYDAAECV
jgi:hypothetical protein